MDFERADKAINGDLYVADQGAVIVSLFPLLLGGWYIAG